MAFGATGNAYDEGFDAFHTGKRNPYKRGTVSAARFAAGYSHARVQHRAEQDLFDAYDDLTAK